MVTTSMSLDSGHNSSHKQKVQDTVGGVLIETYITIRLHTVLSEVREVIRTCKCLELRAELRARKGNFWRSAGPSVCKNGTCITPLLLGGVCSCSVCKINSVEQSPSDDDTHSVYVSFVPFHVYINILFQFFMSYVRATRPDQFFFFFNFSS